MVGSVFYLFFNNINPPRTQLSFIHNGMATEHKKKIILLLSHSFYPLLSIINPSEVLIKLPLSVFFLAYHSKYR